MQQTQTLVQIIAATLVGLLTLAVSIAVELDSGNFLRLLAQQYPSPRQEVGKNWVRFIAANEKQSEPRKVQLVNQFFAQNTRYRTDDLLYKQQDYWATPLETIGLGLGDCEDYAIAKYATLRLLGVSDSKLRLIYVKAQIGGPRSRNFQAHMVLGYYPYIGAEPIILDSLTSAILPASKRSDLSPVFSFNSDGLWTARSTTSVADPKARLSRWESVLKRMKQQGVVW